VRNHSNLRLDRRQRRIPVVLILLVLSLAANAFFVSQWEPKSSDGTLEDTVKALASEGGEAAPEADSAPAAEATPPPAPAEEPTTPEDAPRLAKVTISGPVATAFTDVLGSDEGSIVAITSGRLLGWWLDPSKDPRKGDEAAVLYERDPIVTNEILIHALHYTSQKMGKKFEAFRFQPDGWETATWFDGDGVEVPARLDPPVLPYYEQITALVGDGRGHAGMDFKVDVDTPVLAPFAGTVVRTNWNHRYNGNSIELKSGGRRLRFLHLNHTGVKAGEKVTAGQEIGKSGNTGRSFAPHLHYEIVDGNGRVQNPLSVHERTRRSVPAEAKAAFEAELARLREVLAQEVAETITPSND